MTLANNFEQILQAFNANEVDYLITGGYAVIFHGYGRTTGDLDIWINPSKENKPRLICKGHVRSIGVTCEGLGCIT
ncbi:MAG: hypothetical protein U5K31_06645 [Balneolaceae bacterium]|nr:hypothetical protein [Balneolaceae bacterium]